MEKPKRQRTENWLEDDRLLLQELVKERVLLIENKNTDTATNRKKHDAWSWVLTIFNTKAKGAKRTIPQLKTQWSTIKMQAKKTHANEMKNLIASGEEPQQTIVEITKNDIRSWLPFELTMDIGEYTSNTIQNQDTDKENDSQTDNVSFQPSVHTSENIEEDNSTNTNSQLSILKAETSICHQEDVDVPHTTNKNGNATRIRRFKKHQIANTKPHESIRDISKTEVLCRRELHALQMKNERKRSRNLDLEYKLIMEKIKFLRNKDN